LNDEGSFFVDSGMLGQTKTLPTTTMIERRRF
jgi:hypothetical protein